MVGIPPSNTNEWPQNQSVENAAMMLQTSTGRVMDKPSHEQQQQQALKCPRCESTNTKFCYYNNYSLSQPRHFCKACKRYWTRGGTLRNVPLGGGCRKNKRVKRPTSAMDGSSPSSSSAAHPTANPISSSAQPLMDLSSCSSLNSLLFGLPSNSSEVNLSYPRVPNMEGSVSGYYLQPQFNSLGLGFSSGTMSSSACDRYISNGVDSNRNNQDLLNSKSLLSSHSSIYGNSHSPATTSSPAMTSLLASTLQQQKFINSSDLKATLAPSNVHLFESQIAYINSENKDMKAEGQNRLEWSVPYQNQVEQIGSMYDPSMYWNATTTVGSLHDPANIGSPYIPSMN